MILHIKNMVSNSCKMLVTLELKKMGIHFVFVDLGEVDIMEDLSVGQLVQLKTALAEWGLELLDGNKAILVDKIKNTIIDLVRNTEDELTMKVSDFLSKKLHKDYTYLSNIFSAVQGVSIQQFILLHKIERIKELMFDTKLSIKEISYKMNYSSVPHLSNQFKKITGLSPTHFMKLKGKKRVPIEEIGCTNNKPEKNKTILKMYAKATGPRILPLANVPMSFIPATAYLP